MYIRHHIPGAPNPRRPSAAGDCPSQKSPEEFRLSKHTFLMTHLAMHSSSRTADA